MIQTTKLKHQVRRQIFLRPHQNVWQDEERSISPVTGGMKVKDNKR